MKRFWILAFLAPFSFAYAGHIRKKPAPAANWLNFASYVRDNYRILSQQKRDPHKDQVAFQEVRNRVPSADVPNPVPLPSPTNGNGAGFSGSYGGMGFGGMGSAPPPSSAGQTPAPPAPPPVPPPKPPAGGS